MTAPRGPYAGMFVTVPPRVEVPLEEAGPFACARDTERSPRVTKGLEYRETRVDDVDCAGGACC